MINDFHGTFSFLSNFYPASVYYDNRTWPTVEHAFQAMKTHDVAEQERIRQMPKASMAKSAGKQVKLRANWESIKLNVMEELVRSKFRRSAELRRLMLATGDQELVEGNDWGDRFWGVCNGQGKNHLGRILMKIREEIKRGSLSDSPSK